VRADRPEVQGEVVAAGGLEEVAAVDQVVAPAAAGQAEAVGRAEAVGQAEAEAAVAAARGPLPRCSRAASR
jgi:hypothetical protein